MHKVEKIESKMKLCPESGAASKATSNICIRCKNDLTKVNASETCFVFVENKTIVSQGYYPDLKKIQKMLDEVPQTEDDHFGQTLAKCFASQLAQTEEFEPVITYRVGYHSFDLFVMPSLKIKPAQPST